MAHRSLVPKQRILTEEPETPSSFESWKESMIFHISLDPKSSRFVSDLKTWTTAEDRGFVDDDANYPDADSKMTAVAKRALLNIVLGSVATHAPVISAPFIKKKCTSLEVVWDRLRAHYDLRKTGARILRFQEFQLGMNESRETLWERLYSFMEDSLLTKDGTVNHEGVKVENDEILTPTILNILVGQWLHTINPALPALVRQRFAKELRCNTPFSLRDEISDCIPLLLSEMEEKESIISRAGGYQNQRDRYQKRSPVTKRSCCLCEAAGRPSSSHFLSACPFLPSQDKRYLSRAREVQVEDEFVDGEGDDDRSDMKGAEGGMKALSLADAHSRRIDFGLPTQSLSNTSIQSYSDANFRRVDIVASPVLTVTVGSKASNWTIDSGAEADIITVEECHNLGLKYKPTVQGAKLGDGYTKLVIVGEVHFTASWGHHSLQFGGLVAQTMDSPVLAGMPFLERNDVSINYSSKTIYLGDCCKMKYSAVKGSKRPGAACLRVSSQTCVLPGEKVSFQVPTPVSEGQLLAIEPRMTVPSDMPDWIQCDVISADADGCVTVQNTTSEPVVLSKHTQVCQVRPVLEVDMEEINYQIAQVNATAYTPKSVLNTPTISQKQSDSCYTALSSIKLDPSKVLSKSDQARFHSVHKKHESVFSPGIGRYNGYSGKFVHTVNVGEKIPPQFKGKVPIYNRNDQGILQDKFEELRREGVFARAEDVGVPVEYVHPCFLIKKSDGTHRMVTSFGEVAEYTRPQPTVSSNVEHVLHQIGQWDVVIQTDITHAYYHIELNPESSKYVGVLTPYGGTLVYRRCVMGLPGSEAALEELLSRIFGDLIREGKMVKLADDLFIGAKNVELLVEIWEEVLKRLELNGLKLKPSKTVICPTSTTILGWLWECGKISPLSHRQNALAVCEPPECVRGLRSYIGVYKFLSRVLPLYAEMMKPLEEACGGKESADKIVWSDDLLAAFKKSKEHLREAKPVILPRHEDQLHIVTDAAVNCSGLASAMYVIRANKPVLAGYFNATLKKAQAKLLPCDLEALAIGVSIKHFAYYISQSKKRTRVLTDSLPCVLAYKKLLRGEFSSSPKVTTFLSLASRYGVEIIHISGANNTFSDYASRNPLECNSPQCQICQYVQETASASVGEMKVSDILSGDCSVPFTTKASWATVQQSCPDLIKVHKYLTTGASIPKKKKNMTDVRRYLSCGVTVATGQNSKLLVVQQSTPFKNTTNRIVIPREVSAGLLTALHIQLSHPSAYQLKLVFQRAFFCLDTDSIAKEVVEGCHTCAALKNVPTSYHKQSTSAPADAIGSKYSADVIRGNSQFILFIREDISSYSDAVIIENEKASTLRDGILLLTSRLRSPLGPRAVIRTDPASGLRSLVSDKFLPRYNLSIELGEPKNINKNPIAEKGIEELRAEIVRLQPTGGKITPTILAQAVANLNSRIRQSKLSAREVWTQRDMTTGIQIQVDDKELIDRKQSNRCEQHGPSARYKAKGKLETDHPKVATGDIVYLFGDRSKLHVRDKYMIVGFEGDMLKVKKFAGSQFRSREYKVKFSDIITVPKCEERSAISPNDDLVSTPKIPVPESVKTSDRKTNSACEYTPSDNNQKPVPRVYYSSSEDSDDDDNPYIKLPGIPVNQVQQRIPTVLLNDEEEELIAAVVNARPTRNTRPPKYLEDYEQDISAILESDVEEEVLVILESAEEEEILPEVRTLRSGRLRDRQVSC